MGDMYVQSFLGFRVEALWGLRFTEDSLPFPPIDQRVLHSDRLRGTASATQLRIFGFAQAY